MIGCSWPNFSCLLNEIESSRARKAKTAHIITLTPNCSRLHGQFAHGGKTINASFGEFKGKDTFFVSQE